jgi:transcriptional regulator with XRE-family HTH domain
MSPAEPGARNKRVGARIRKRRQVLGWEQRELAERVGVHVNSVQKWEAGTHYPGRKLGKLEQVLGIRVDDGLEPEPEPAIPDSLMKTIRRSLSEEDQRIAIDALERALGPRPPEPPGAEERPPGQARRAG